MLFFALGLSAAVAADWPQFLGPTRDGVSVETGIGQAWAKDGPRVLWRAPGGNGMSGLSVVSGTAYSMYDDAGGEHVVALDALTGARRWDARVEAPYIDGQGFHGPRATPTVAGDRVVALTASGVLLVLSRADGAVIWRTDLTALGGQRSTWGYSGSPLVSDGVVYVGIGAEDGRGIAALSLADGSEIWHVGGWGAAYSSPVRATFGGVDQVVFFTASGPVSVAPSTGSLLWELPWKTQYGVNAATPLVSGDRLLVASGYGSGGMLLKVGATGPTELWRSKSVKNKLATSVVSGGYLYGFSDERLVAVDLARGAPVWEQTGFGYGTVLLADGHLVVTSDDGRVGLARATPTAFTEVGKAWQVLKGPKCWTAPALANGVLYLRDNAEFVALDTRPL